MGSLDCSRLACQNVMVDTYVTGVGYVCKECQREFKEYLKTQGFRVTTEGEMRKALEKFMETRKDDFTKGNDIDVDQFFEQYTQ